MSGRRRRRRRRKRRRWKRRRKGYESLKVKGKKKIDSVIQKKKMSVSVVFP